MAEAQTNTLPEIEPQTGLIAWFAHNHVAANLLMIFVIVGGIYSLMVVKKESFPGFQSNQLIISMAYPGAAPNEVEEGVVVKIEEAVDTIRGIKERRGIAN